MKVLKMSEDKVKNILKEVFKHDRFKSDAQENATREIFKSEIVFFQVIISSFNCCLLLGTKDVIVSMPTGSGKSLCYQLPAALYDDKVALVFSPLLALIKVRLGRYHCIDLHSFVSRIKSIIFPL